LPQKGAARALTDAIMETNIGIIGICVATLDNVNVSNKYHLTAIKNSLVSSMDKSITKSVLGV
jgi:hypothetical protein